MPDLTVYWRPGCALCTGLMRALDARAVPYEQVNIWADPEAAAAVRAAAGGTETVPAVRVGEVVLSNPSVGQILTVAHRLDPATDLPEPPPPSRTARMLWRLLGGARPR